MSKAISVCHGQFGRAALYQLDTSLITHAHREGHLIFHIDGSFSHVAINNDRNTVDLQHGAAVSPLEPHSFDVNETVGCVVLVVYIKPAWFLENSQSEEYTLRFGCSQIFRTQQINAVLHRFTSCLLNEASVEVIDSLLFSLTTLCYEQTWQKVKSPNLLQSDYSNFSDHRIRRSLQTMQQSISVEVSIEELATAAGLSRPHFFKLFKKQLGVTPNLYLNTLRSERAIAELINTEKTITDISNELGYSSQAAFTRFFSNNVGIAPSEYRRVADYPL